MQMGSLPSEQKWSESEMKSWFVELSFVLNMYEFVYFCNCQHFRNASIKMSSLPFLETTGGPSRWEVTLACWNLRSTSLPAGATGCPRCCYTGGGRPPLGCRVCCTCRSLRLSGCRTGQSPPRRYPDPSSPTVFSQPFQRTIKSLSIIWELFGIWLVSSKFTWTS